MYKIIEKVIDVLLDELKPSRIEQRIKDQKASELGTELFLLYISTNTIISEGFSIVASLDTYLERMARHISKGDDAYATTFNTFVGKRIVNQKENIIKFGESASRLSDELDLVSAEAHRELRRLLSGKFNALNNLLQLLNSGNFPVNHENLLIPSDPHLHSQQLTELRRSISKIPLLPLEQSWDEKIYPIIQSYMASGEARTRLTEISKAAESLKNALEKHFSLKDVLIKVGDRRLKTSTGDYFWGH